MKISLGAKVNYYSKCPFCGTARAEGTEKCINCGKSLLQITEQENTIPDEDKDIALYKARDEKTASENLKELKGKNKFRYFMDYYFGKVVFGIILAALACGLLYSFFKPRQEPALYTVIVVNPFTPTAYDQFKADLEEMLVTDPKHQNIILDNNYSSLIADYNSGMAFTMHMAAGEVDMVIFNKDELKYQVNSEALIPVDQAISKDIFNKLPDDIKIKVTPTYPLDNGDFKYGEEAVYGLNIEKFLERINGFETSSKYCVAFTRITEKHDALDTVVKYMFDIN